MTTSATDTSRRNAGIDFLRGLAVLLVILHHTGLRLPLKHTVLANWIPVRILNALNFNGSEAVFIFFVISGFLITNISLQRWNSLGRINIKAFYSRRFARIMPCLLLLIAVLSALHIAEVPYYTINRPDQSLGGAIFSALTMHLNWYEGQTGYLPGGWDVLWSLSIEEAFYFLFPILCLLIASRRLFMFLLVILALSLPVTRAALDGNDIWQEKAYLPGMAAIATGVLSALLAQRTQPSQSSTQKRIMQLFLATGVVGTSAVLLYEDILWKLLGNGTLLILTGASACLVLSFYWREQMHPRQSPPRGLGWLCTMGRQSYEIYLTHMFVVFSIVGTAIKLDLPKIYSFFWYAPAVLLSWLLGAALERWYSRPCDISLRNRLMRK